ncbi:acyl carrier protein [Dyella tabacisoli]|uniref:Acyl carrier protein n=1 Tax=Dyella tabacisoli TaxID=2282381 RepID=A0A369US89_9GAMM|nr:acyl carrier protein [Dyella tabacisoli]RDD83183.1 acyl carrier protein [Dyella tabacisoli]
MQDLTASVISVIAETFSVDASSISRHTVAADVDGWDSLSHTVLMIRLEKCLGMRIDERVALKANSVGALIDALRNESACGEST